MNLNQRKHGHVHAELDSLARLGILAADQVGQLKDRYPTTAWDFMALIRAFSALGALTAVAGLIVLIREHLNWWLVSESALALSAVGLLVLGHWIRTRNAASGIGATAELVGSIAMQGLMTVLAIHHSTGSSNWPGLLGAETVVLAVLAYAVASRLVLWYAGVNFFFWFGAETGYMAGWGCYWLGMTYPVRFLAAGMGTLLLSWLHARIVRGRWAVFSRVYAHYGLLVTNLALWFLSLFGYYESYDLAWSDTQGERLLFSLLWACVAGGSLFAGARFGVRLLRGYGLTFLIINLYTFYFQFVAAHTGETWFLHLLLTGGSLLWLGFHLERRRRSSQQEDARPQGMVNAQERAEPVTAARVSPREEALPISRHGARQGETAAPLVPTDSAGAPQEWFYCEDGQEVGPLSEADVAKLIDSGKIGPTTLVRHARGMAEWTPLARVGADGQPPPADIPAPRKS